MEADILEKILLIINPRAGKKKNNDFFKKITNFFQTVTETAEIRYTESRGHAIELARSAQDFERVICIGGDGTLNEVCNGLMQLEKNIRPVLGYIPCGSTNDFARGIGLPKRLDKSLKLSLSEDINPIDIGFFNGDNIYSRYFTYVASFGLFTDISYNTDQRVKNKFGHMAYIFEGIKNLTELQKYKPFKLKIKTDDYYIEEEYIFGAVSNSTSLGGLVKLDKKNVKVNDGYFELLLIKKPDNFWALTDTVTRLYNKKYCFEKILFRHANNLTLESESPINWTLDGEFAGSFRNVNIKVCGESIKIARAEEVRTKPLLRKKLP